MDPIGAKTHFNSVSVVLVVLMSSAFAQYGTAPANLYPTNYGGSTFSGVVVDTHQEEITLEYKHGKKDDIFKGRFEAGCTIHMPDKTERKITAKNIPNGSLLTVYFNPPTKKSLPPENLIIAVTFDEINGQRVAEGKKMVHYCSKDLVVKFKAF